MEANSWSIGLVVNNRVPHGDQMASLEGRKVEKSIRPPTARVLSAINVNKGDSVDPDVFLICLSVVNNNEHDEPGNICAKRSTKGCSSGHEIAHLRKRVEFVMKSYKHETDRCVTSARGSDPAAPRAVVSAVPLEFAAFVAATKGCLYDVREAIVTGSIMLRIEVVSHRSCSNSYFEQTLNISNHVLTTMWVSKGILPTAQRF